MKQGDVHVEDHGQKTQGAGQQSGSMGLSVKKKGLRQRLAYEIGPSASLPLRNCRY